MKFTKSYLSCLASSLTFPHSFALAQLHNMGWHLTPYCLSSTFPKPTWRTSPTHTPYSGQLFKGVFIQNILYKSFYYYFSWRCFKNSKMTLSLIILVFIHFVVHNFVDTKLSPVLKCALGHFKHDCDYRKHTLFHMTWLLVLVAWTCVFFYVIQLCFQFPKSRAVCYIDLKTCKHETKEDFCVR